MHLQSGSALNLNDNNFNLAGQPTIFMSNISCVNTNVNYSSGSSSSWNFGASSSPQTPTGSAVTTQYGTTGRRDVIFGANTYTGFANIIMASNVSPVVGTNAPLVAGQYRVCAGSQVSFQALNPGVNYVYSWTMGGGSTPNTYNGTTFSTVNNATFNTPGTYNITLNYTTDCCGLSPVATLTLIVDPQPTVSITGPTAFCAGTGNAVVLVASGSTSYTWSPSAGLNTTTGSSVIAYPSSTTTYTVTGVNAAGNCFASQNVTVTVRQVNLATNSVNASCGSNGSASVTPSGGSGSYSYAWSGGQTTSSITGQAPGTYTVTVTDNVTGCVANASVAVSPGPGAPTAFISNITPVSCTGGNNGTATVALTGGVGPFAYNWSSGGGSGATTNPLAAGTYNVTIIDFGNPGCPIISSASIPQPNPLSSSVLSVDSANCPTNNGEATVNASGGTGPYNYNWGFATGATQTGLAAGTYTVTVTDSRGCISNVSVTIDCILPVEYAYLQANPFNGDIRLDWATTEELDNQRFDILRSLDGQNFVKIGQVPSRVGTGGGAEYSFVDTEVATGVKYYYRLQQFDFDGNSDFSNVVSAILPHGSAPLVKLVYPNPFEDVVTMELDVEDGTELRVDIVNMAGQSVGISKKWNLQAGSRSVKLDLRNLPAGMYFGKLYVEGSQVGSVKLIKQ